MSTRQRQTIITKKRITPVIVRLSISLLICALTGAGGLLASPAWAQQAQASEMLTPTPLTTSNPAPVFFQAPVPSLDAKAYVLMDANSGVVIASKAAQEKMPPASLTKMMTLYVVSQALKSGQIHLDDQVTISKKAWKMQGSRMFVKVGSQVAVKDLIQGIIVQSGNDACTAMAEYVGGSEDAFAALMNQAAQQLGMTHSHFVDSTGLPQAEHYSTAQDLAILAHALIRDFPQDYHWYRQKWFTYNKIKQPNRNRLLWRDPSVDGLKTGHTDAAGYCLVSSAKRGEMRLISVLMGAPTDTARSNESEALLNFGFHFFESHALYKANQSLSEQRVWLGKAQNTHFGLAKTLYVTIPKGSYQQLQASMSANQKLQAPIQKGQVYGHIQVNLHGKTVATAPLIALEDNPTGGFFHRMMDHMRLFFHG